MGYTPLLKALIIEHRLPERYHQKIDSIKYFLKLGPLPYNLILKKFKKWQWDSLEKNRKRQRNELYKLIKYIHKNIPYYKRIIKKNNIKYSKKTIFKDIEKFPTLTKKIIRECFDELINKEISKSEYKENYSGGTTGEPVKLLQNRKCLKYMGAITSLQYFWTGRSNEMLIQLWGSERDIFNNRKKNRTGIVKFGNNHYILNSFIMSKKDMERYRKFINKKKPLLIVAYVQSVYEFTKFIKENKLKIHKPKSILTSAGTLYEDQKKLIEEVFECKVFNRYGSREVHNMASDCEKHEGLHVDTFCHYMEILDKNLSNVKKEGEIGEVYITLFHNPIMPLIRYKIGDFATYTKHKCSCGRGLPLIKTVNGRTVDLFINTKGEKIDGEYFTHLFYSRDWVKRFQVIQKRKDMIEIKYSQNKKANVSDKKDIESKIKIVMGKNCKVKWNFVKNIPPSKSGKFRYTISEINS